MTPLSSLFSYFLSLLSFHFSSLIDFIQIIASKVFKAPPACPVFASFDIASRHDHDMNLIHLIKGTYDRHHQCPNHTLKSNTSVTPSALENLIQTDPCLVIRRNVFFFGSVLFHYRRCDWGLQSTKMLLYYGVLRTLRRYLAQKCIYPSESVSLFIYYFDFCVHLDTQDSTIYLVVMLISIH